MQFFMEVVNYFFMEVVNYYTFRSGPRPKKTCERCGYTLHYSVADLEGGQTGSALPLLWATD